MHRNVSTPNDFALEFTDAFDNTVTVMVCKYQEGPWNVKQATAFGGNNSNVMWSTLDHLQGDDYHQAVANATAHVEHQVHLAKNIREELGALEGS